VGKKIMTRISNGLGLCSVSLSALALCLSACGSSEGSDDGGAAGTGGAPAAPTDVGSMQPSATTCTAPHTICMNMQVPSTMEGQPTQLVFDIYDTAQTPTHLPNGYAGFFTAPSVTPSAQMYFELSDAELQGDYWMWVLMYMPGGGYGAPVSGVDYVMVSAPTPLHLDGTPLNIDAPVVLGL
jgi:hypothetical protein